MDRKSWPELRARLFRMVSVGVVDEPMNQCYDVLSTLALIVNLAVSILATFESLTLAYGPLLTFIEAGTVAFFLVDYVLRLLTAPDLYPDLSGGRGRIQYALSFSGIVDLLSFLPYYLPVFFPSGAVVFRLFRVARILRLFRVNAYYDSLNVITAVLKRKRQQLLSSVFILSVLMLGASLCMYSLEHAAQPQVFKNAFSGIWWAVSTLTTVGYGDIYPVTPLGKAFSIVITFLGVGVVAIPTGIISAGFVEQYSKLGKSSAGGQTEELATLQVTLVRGDRWCGRQVKHLALPSELMLAVILRKGELLAPAGEVILLPGDELVFTRGRESAPKENLELKRITLGKGHPWRNLPIRNLPISRQEVILKVKRKARSLPPEGALVLQTGDELLLFGKKISQEEEEEGIPT